MILIRAMVGMSTVLAVIAFSARGFRQLRTQRPWVHLARVAIVMVSNATYFLGLAALPLADAVALAFIAPVLITALSALCYASSHMLTRVKRATESAMTLNFYVQCGCIAVSSAMGLWEGDGHPSGSADPSLAFLFREWVWPPLRD